MPRRRVLQGAGALGLAALAAVAGFSSTAAAQELTTLYSFTGTGTGDGAYPHAGLIADAAGNLYGTTMNGGAQDAGTVFQLTPSATLNVLHSFTGSGDGALPFAGLIADAAGNLYGTTIGGDGPGTVFQLTPSGTLNVLHRFTGRDGAIPHGALIFDAPGNLYGTTHNGGTSGYGTVFQLTPSGALNVLHSFTGGSDGTYPEAGVIADAAGNLYGTTYGGGANGQGTVFQLTPSGALNVLHSFTGGTDGGRPVADLIADAAGNLYGTTALGGANMSCTGGCGTVFELTVPASFIGGQARRNMNTKALRQGVPRMGRP